MSLSRSAAVDALVVAAHVALADYTEDDLDAAPVMQGLLKALDDYDAAVKAEKSRRLNEHLARTLGSNYRYWELSGVRFCYNTSPETGGDGRWFAFEYRPISAGQMRLAREVKCATRTKAKARAYSWFKTAKERTR